MKIDGLPMPPAATAAAVPPPPQQGAKWRQVLEQALWQDRLRVPLPRHDAAGAGDAGAAPPPAAADAARAAVAAEDPATTPAQRAALLRDAAVAASEAGRPVTLGARPAAATAPLQGVAPSPSLPARAGLPAGPVGPARPQAAAALPPLPALAPASPSAWPAVAGQVSVQGRQVSASLRDASIEEAEADELGRALQRELSRAGLELAELHVNGRSVALST